MNAALSEQLKAIGSVGRARQAEPRSNAIHQVAAENGCSARVRCWRGRDAGEQHDRERENRTQK